MSRLGFSYIHFQYNPQIRERMICLKMDCVSRFNRQFLGINIQFRAKEGELRFYTLKMVEMMCASTGENIAAEVKKVLRDFEISENQLYCVTIDNGSNFLKMVRILNEPNTPEVDGFPVTEDGEEDMQDDAMDVNMLTNEEWSVEVKEHVLTSLLELQEKFIDEIQTECEESNLWIYSKHFYS